MPRVALLAALMLLAGCGGEEERAAAKPELRGTTTASSSAPEPAATPAAAGSGTRIVLRDSEFGTMLFGPGRQAIYVFERDGRNDTNCHGECAELWPPVYSKGKPRAGKGVRPGLLGTIRRGDRRQVTYAGRPLYYYAHEGPGQVLCHNVDLNGGLWWVVGPSGEPRP